VRRARWRVSLIFLCLAACCRTGQADGNLTSSDEIAAMRELADQGVAYYVASREALRREAKRSWRWGSVTGTFTTTLEGGEKTCHPVGDAGPADTLEEGAPDAYAKILSHHFGGGSDAEPDADLAQEARARVLDWIDTQGFHGPGGHDWSGQNQCILELGISIPVWIETAILLEGTPTWTSADRASFARWLAREVYPKVAWASRVRRNNWGAAGSLSASAIARYVAGWVPELVEVEPEPRTLAADSAWREHDAIQLARIGTHWEGDSECERHGIQDHGGIPDELRRGAGGCDATSIPHEDDRGLTYQTTQVELLVYHAELLRRTGDDTLFSAKTPGGVPALLQSILFVIDNPSPGGASWPWGPRTGTLAVAYGAYGDSRLLTATQDRSSFRGGRTLPYALLAPAGERITR
jgi:hypothetical protein